MASVLSDPEIVAALARQAPSWRYESGFIARTWRTAGWKATMMAANAVAHLAEVAWHHPEMRLRFDALEVRLHTHDARGVTAKDLALAAKIDTLLDWHPGGDGGPLDGGPPDDPAAAYLRSGSSS